MHLINIVIEQTQKTDQRRRERGRENESFIIAIHTRMSTHTSTNNKIKLTVLVIQEFNLPEGWAHNKMRVVYSQFNVTILKYMSRACSDKEILNAGKSNRIINTSAPLIH